MPLNKSTQRFARKLERTRSPFQKLAIVAQTLVSAAPRLISALAANTRSNFSIVRLSGLPARFPYFFSAGFTAVMATGAGRQNFGSTAVISSGGLLSSGRIRITITSVEVAISASDRRYES
jgi:hypothetical protein